MSRGTGTYDFDHDAPQMHWSTILQTCRSNDQANTKLPHTLGKVKYIPQNGQKYSRDSNPNAFLCQM